MLTAFNFAVAMLAVFYLSYVMTQTAGPFKIFSTLRRIAPLGGLTLCIYCLSVWIGAIACIMVMTPAAFVVYPFAAAGAAMLLYRYTGGDRT
jgi:hypothetical protein